MFTLGVTTNDRVIGEYGRTWKDAVLAKLFSPIFWKYEKLRETSGYAVLGPRFETGSSKRKNKLFKGYCWEIVNTN